MMLTKVFLQTQFGTPHPWTEQYLENVKMLEAHGWYLKVFTPNAWKSSGNIEIVPMTIEQFDELLGRTCGVKAGNYLKDGVPAKLVSDYYPAYGQIFQEYIRDFDFWGHSNWDMVYGRLDRFIPDCVLENCDIWSDDVHPGGLGVINGIFCFYRNNDHVNNLFRNVPDWQHSFTVHEPAAFDEIQMTLAVRELAARGEVRFMHPPNAPLHKYDRIPPHVPEPQLEFAPDGGLIEKYPDSAMQRPHFLFPRDHFPNEIMSFHFVRTKKYPLHF